MRINNHINHTQKLDLRYFILTQNYQSNLSLFTSFTNTPRSALRTQLQGSAHTVADSSRPLRTQLQSLYLLPTPSTQTYRRLYIVLLKNPLHYRSKIVQQNLATSTHRASLYLYLSMDRDPRAGRFILHFFTLFLGRLPFDFDLLQIALRASRGTFTFALPKIASFVPHDHCTRLPLPNSPPTQSS